MKGFVQDAPPRYRVQFEWPEGRPRDARPTRGLIADSLEDAKLEAAILYATADMPRLPQAYRIVRGARTVVYRYPERARR